MLFLSSPTAAPPLHWDWLQQWWRVYGEKYGQMGRGLRIVTVWRNENLIGGLPLYLTSSGNAVLRSKRLGFLSTGEAEDEETCPDYMDLLHAVDEVPVCLAAISEWIECRRDKWDFFELNYISANSPLLSLPQHMRGRRLKVSVSSQGACPVADLSGGFETYLLRLSSTNRQQMRRQLRAAESGGLFFEVAQKPDEAEVFFRQLVSLHQSRWSAVGKPGCFASPRFTDFHASLARIWATRGEAVLARVSAGETAIAVLYGFVSGSAFHFYQSGIQQEVPGVRSPGVAAHLLLMRYLASQGIEVYDFLRGASTYKLRLSTGERALSGIEIYPPIGRHTLGVASGLAKRALRKGWLLARKASTSNRLEAETA